MAKVSLRIYNREIESLIDQGHTDEAIAHCRHILKTFPKHLETYRLLGKAYLEFKRYNEAVDIFSRVLMSVPDDFVSHVGMSIINDEQNRIDNAIWHMERAFEAQPSNPAIQGELQRLYGRRDGMEPPKVRMTRGALAHMYVQGELYPQAIAEIRAVLAQDPNRTDMQVLLAKAYFKGGQRADASDMCSQLLKRHLYCFDANRIMVDSIPANQGAAESTQVYRMRVGELDPYATFAKDSVFLSGDVADAAINLERLEYTGEEVPMGQEWSSSLGIKLDSSSAPTLDSANSSDQPDWLKSFSSSQNDPFGGPQSFDNSQNAQPAQADDSIPDFLRAAGWGESSGEAEQPVSFFDTPDPVADNGMAPADIPDWLKGQMPSEAVPSAPSNAAQGNPPVPSMDTPDWLSGLDNSQDASSQSFDSISSEPAFAQQANVPDWLSGLGNSDSEQPQADLPPAQPADIPDWLNGPSSQPDNSASIDSLGASAQEQDDAVAWLQSLAAKHGAKPEELVTDPNKRSEIAPDWVQQASASQTSAPAADINTLGASAQEQDDAVAWLESLAAKHGAKPEELVTDPNKRSEIAPDWVQQASASQTSAPAADINALGASAQEQDDAVAWLESLAAKHGAKPEELVTDPNKRSDVAPEWVQQATSAAEMQPTVPSKPKDEMTEQPKEWSENAMNIGEQFFAEFETASSSPDETGMWLRNLDDKKDQEEDSLKRADIPDWLSDSKDSDQEIKGSESAGQGAGLPDWMSGLEQNTDAEFTPVVQTLSQDELSNWLNDLDDKPKNQATPAQLPDWSDDALDAQKTHEENLWDEPSKSESVPSESVKSDLPDWLSGIDSKTEETDDDWNKPAADGLIYSPAPSPAEEAAPVQLTADLPDWLQGVDEESTVIEDDDNTPPWMHRESWESEDGKIQPKPTNPSDWHPVEPKPVATAAQPKQQKPAAPAAQKPVPAKKNAVKQPEVQSGSSVLNQAKGELDRGDIPAALEHYEKLIKKGKHLEDVIRDLNESLYRYPVEVGIWQTLGDAYMRSNRLKEALEAYNKAEELIR